MESQYDDGNGCVYYPGLARGAHLSPEHFPRPIASKIIDHIPLPSPLTTSFGTPLELQDEDCVRRLVSSRNTRLRPTLTRFPATPSLSSTWGLPWGCIIQPFACGPPHDEIPLLPCERDDVPRCYACRGYLNPFVHVLPDGRRWQCNMCRVVNVFPEDFFPKEGHPSFEECQDGKGLVTYLRRTRPELREKVIDFVAPHRYNVRRACRKRILFVFDASSLVSDQPDIVSDSIKAVCEALAQEHESEDGSGICDLDVGFLTFASTLQVYPLDGTSSLPSQVVLADLPEKEEDLPELIHPSRLFASNRESRDRIVSLLHVLPSLAMSSRTGTVSRLADAMALALQLVSFDAHIGKIVLVSHSLPFVGKRVPKDTPSVSSSASFKLKNALSAAEDVGRWLHWTERCVEKQASIDILTCEDFHRVFASIVKSTGGNLFQWKLYNRHPTKTVLNRRMQDLMWGFGVGDCVLKVRTSPSIVPFSFHGCLSLYGKELVMVPSIDKDWACGVTFKHRMMSAEFDTVFVQAGIVFTHSSGERRIRVLNMALPTASTNGDLFRSVDAGATMLLMAKMNAAEHVCSVLNILSVKEGFTRRISEDDDITYGRPDLLVPVMLGVVEMLSMYRKVTRLSFLSDGSLSPIPYLTIALMKSRAFHDPSDSDNLIELLHVARSGVKEFLRYILPIIQIVDPATGKSGSMTLDRKRESFIGGAMYVIENSFGKVLLKIRSETAGEKDSAMSEYLSDAELVEAVSADVLMNWNEIPSTTGLDLFTSGVFLEDATLLQKGFEEYVIEIERK